MLIRLTDVSGFDTWVNPAWVVQVWEGEGATNVELAVAAPGSAAPGGQTLRVVEVPEEIHQRIRHERGLDLD